MVVSPLVARCRRVWGRMMALRRTGIKRDGPGARAFANAPRKSLARTSLKQSGSGLARKPLRQRSKAQVDDSVRQASVRAEVFARDGHQCVIAQYKGTVKGAVIHGNHVAPIYLPACHGPLTFGHRRHAGAGGAYVPANGACVCLGCNDFCADNADDIRAIFGTGLIVREGDAEWESLGRKANGVR